MKCPHCNESIGLFSKELNRFRKIKSCPHCQEPIRLAIDPTIGALLIFAAVTLTYLLKPFYAHFGLDGAIVAGVTTGLAVMLSFRIKPS